MNYDKVMAMTAAEVRVAVAKAQGWQVRILSEIRDEDGVIKYDDILKTEYALVSPKNQPISKLRGKYELKDFISDLPDLSDPCVFMLRMGDLWNREKEIAFDATSIGWNWLGLGFGFDDYIEYGPDKDVKGLGEAIARAWLIICGGEG
jgi:hypothetical protein